MRRGTTRWSTSNRGPLPWLLSLACAACAGRAPAAQVQAPATAEEPAQAETVQPAAAAAQPTSPQPSPPPGAASEGSISRPATLVVKDAFAAPESVLYDIEADVYLVSNVNGSPFAADDNGFISRVSPEGHVVTLKWIDGADPKVHLNAPKGMAISAGVLFVADLDRIRKFDSQSGAALGDIPVPGATFINDVTSGPDGIIYFTDSGMRQTAKGFDRTGTDAVYKLDKSHPVAIARGKQLNAPNGVMVDAAGVWVVTTSAKELYDVKKGSKARVQQLPSGMLDGIIRTSAGQLYISSWEQNQIFTGEPGGTFTKAFELQSPADIGYDVKRHRLLVPLMLDNSLQFLPL